MYRTLVQWEFQGVWHEPGETGDYATVPDLPDLIRIGTVERLPEPEAPASKPSKGAKADAQVEGA